MFRKCSSCVKHAILFTRNPIEDDEDGTPCFICKDGSTYNNELQRCRGDVRCSARCHKSCIAEAMKATNKKLNCPCGSDYGSYVGPRSSLTLTVYTYTIIGLLLKINWNRYSLYPRTTATLTIVLYSIIHYNISTSLAWILLGYPLLLLLSWTFIVFSMRNVRVKTQAKNIFEWCCGPRGDWSSLEIFIDSIHSNRHEENVDIITPLLNVYSEVFGNSFSPNIYSLLNSQRHNIINLGSLLGALIDPSPGHIVLNDDENNHRLEEELQNIPTTALQNLSIHNLTSILTNSNVVIPHDDLSRSSQRPATLDLTYLRTITESTSTTIIDDSDYSVEELHSTVTIESHPIVTSCYVFSLESFQNNEGCLHSTPSSVFDGVDREKSSQQPEYSTRSIESSGSRLIIAYPEQSSRSSSNILEAILQ